MPVLNIEMDELTPEESLKKECLRTASRALTAGIIQTMMMDPHEAALGAYIEKVTPSVEELEAQIRGFHAEAEARWRDKH